MWSEKNWVEDQNDLTLEAEHLQGRYALSNFYCFSLALKLPSAEDCGGKMLKSSLSKKNIMYTFSSYQGASYPTLFYFRQVTIDLVLLF